jgi:hypothetical protein
MLNHDRCHHRHTTKTMPDSSAARQLSSPQPPPRTDRQGARHARRTGVEPASLQCGSQRRAYEASASERAQEAPVDHRREEKPEEMGQGAARMMTTGPGWEVQQGIGVRMCGRRVGQGLRLEPRLSAVQGLGSTQGQATAYFLPWSWV